MSSLSTEQLEVINAPLSPLAVIACAGSGKTRTAIERLAEIRRRLGNARAYPTLLSFSNVAIESFKRDYKTLVLATDGRELMKRVCIETQDSFISTKILRPHAHRTMECAVSPYLVTGSEKFLEGFKLKTRTSNIPLSVSDVKVGHKDGEIYFYNDVYGSIQKLPTADVIALVKRLARSGAYTHELGRYWAYETLKKQPLVLRALAHRHPHILVDEAQDVGSIHEAIIEKMIDAGSQVSLIGDPNQAIYQFADADGNFLKNYPRREDVIIHTLSTNYRSVPEILSIANLISNRTDEAVRSSDNPNFGAYFIPYRPDNQRLLVDAFQSTLPSLGLDYKRSAVICRAKEVAQELRGQDTQFGAGIMKGMVKAAIWRDARADFNEAFKEASASVLALLDGVPPHLLSSLERNDVSEESKILRRYIWSFVRDANIGLPAATLNAYKEWYPRLMSNLGILLDSITSSCGYKGPEKLSTKLKRTKLPDEPFIGWNFDVDRANLLRIDTVHKVKGESLDAVLYVASKANANALINGVNTEEGRIGYVALTRTRNLFWLAVPEPIPIALQARLISLGFKPLNKEFRI